MVCLSPAGKELLRNVLGTAQARSAKLTPLDLHRLWALSFQGPDLSQQQQQVLQALLAASTSDSPLLQPIRAALSHSNSALSSALPDLALINMAGELQNATSLAGYLEELGYAATASEAAFRDVLQQLESVDEHAVAQAFGMMARTHSDLHADPHGLHASLAAALGSHIGTSSPPTVHSHFATWHLPAEACCAWLKACVACKADHHDA